jgi:DNA-binding NarL/FixJ family response regulator
MNTGGILVVSRNKANHDYFKQKLEEKGFTNLFVTAVDRDGLNSIIDNMKPSLVMIEACFYKEGTPYMMKVLLKAFPKLNIAIVNMYDYPEEKAKLFILYGVKSYVNMYEGAEEFGKGLMCVKNGRAYVSPNIKELISLLDEIPEEDDMITLREKEVADELCQGISKEDIAKNLCVSVRTIEKHIENLYKAFNVDSVIQLFWVTATTGIITVGSNTKKTKRSGGKK